MNLVDSVTQSIFNSYRQFESSIQFLPPSIFSTISMINEAFNTLNTIYNLRSREHIVNLVEYGWYPCLGVKNYALNTFIIENPTEDDYNKLMADFVENNLDTIKDNILEICNNREHIINDCFEAHEMGKYTLSIPVMFMQIDGISKEIFGENFFKTMSKTKAERDAERNDSDETIDDRKPTITKKIEKLEIDYTQLINVLCIYPLTVLSSISRSEKNNFDYLNRHTVLHGNNLSYNTKLNSYKAIILLNYFADLKSIL